jgi:hypothetical protein
MKKLFGIVCALCFFMIQTAYGAVGGHGFTSLTGGAAGSLDGILTATIDDTDLATGYSSDTYYVYIYDASSVLAESSPGVIIPDDNVSGTGAWIQAGGISFGQKAAPDSIGLKEGTTAGGLYKHSISGSDLSANRSTTMPDYDGGIPASTVVSSTGGLAVNTIGTFTVPITTNPYSFTAANLYNSVLWYGATGEVDLDPGVGDMATIIYNTGAFTITIDPNGSEAIVRDGTAQTGGVSITLSSGAGNFVALVFDGTQWVTMGFKGTLAEGS